MRMFEPTVRIGIEIGSELALGLMLRLGLWLSLRLGSGSRHPQSTSTSAFYRQNIRTLHLDFARAVSRINVTLYFCFVCLSAVSYVTDILSFWYMFCFITEIWMSVVQSSAAYSQRPLFTV